jgi:hypothetical protein
LPIGPASPRSLLHVGQAFQFPTEGEDLPTRTRRSRRASSSTSHQTNARYWTATPCSPFAFVAMIRSAIASHSATDRDHLAQDT